MSENDVPDLPPTRPLRDEDKPTAASPGRRTKGGAQLTPRYLDWKPGVRIAGRYTIVRNLGVGGTGLVVVADDHFLRKPVAVKALRPSVAQDPDNVERFRKEVALCHAITHPNIVRTYDLGEDRGVHYFSMEYLSGEPLSKRLRREGTLPPNEVRELGVYICKALHAAHAARIVHRDLKPSNIMLVDDDRKVVVMDFGISGTVDEEDVVPPDDQRHKLDTRAGDTGRHWDVTSAGWGTPKYMSPEQWAGLPCGPESDIYSLGAILFQCLTGNPPFEAQSDKEFAALHTNKEAPTLRSVNPALPRDLDVIVSRCLAKEPADRYPSADQLGEVLLGERKVPSWVRFGGRAVGLAVVLALLAWGVIALANQAIIREMRPAVSRLAELTAQGVDKSDLDAIHEADDYTKPEFERVREYFLRVAEDNPEAFYIYTLRALDEPGSWEFVVDKDPFPEDSNEDGRIDPDEMGAMPGQFYDGSSFPSMTRALVEGTPTADEEFVYDIYGRFLSGYAPIGRTRGPGGYVLGIDVNWEYYRDERLKTFNRTVIGFCVLAWLALLLVPRGFSLLRRRKRKDKADLGLGA